MKTFPVREINPTASEPKISQVFRIRKVEDMLAGKDMLQETHRHNFFFILCLRKGQGTHVIDFTHYDIVDNCIFMMRPGQVHQMNLSASSTGYLLEFSHAFYHLNDRGTSHLARKAAASNFCQLAEANFDKVYAIVENIFQEYQEAKDDYHEVIRAELDIFFIQFTRFRRLIAPGNTNTTSYEQERFDDFLALIEKHFASKKQVADYADMLNLSGYQLSAITKAVVAKTPSELINEYIVLESKRYLLSTSDQINQIAATLGYDDPSYFIRFFRKHTGYSPEAFRLQKR